MSKAQIVHTHWLYGRGPNKTLDFVEHIEKETQCGDCSHNVVCAHDMTQRCINYSFGTSEHRGCMGCVHRYTRWDGDNSVPCFKCNEFLRG